MTQFFITSYDGVSIEFSKKAFMRCKTFGVYAEDMIDGGSERIELPAVKEVATEKNIKIVKKYLDLHDSDKFLNDFPTDKECNDEEKAEKEKYVKEKTEIGAPISDADMEFMNDRENFDEFRIETDHSGTHEQQKEIAKRNKESQKSVYEMLILANYMSMQELTWLCANYIAKKITAVANKEITEDEKKFQLPKSIHGDERLGVTPQANIRMAFDLPDDMTQEDHETLDKELDPPGKEKDSDDEDDDFENDFE